MSERYSRLFALPEDLYSVGSPVVIAAGALLKDNQTGKVIGQLKLRSISEKAIKAVKVKLNLFDTAGNPIGEGVEHSYLDLNAARDSEFGQKSPIAVPEVKTRSYQAVVTEVVFADQSVWTSDEGVWKSLEKPTTVSITDPELLKQYQMQFGTGAKYDPKTEKDLWHCTCGALNHEGENCHVCGHSLFKLQTVDMEKLTADKDARLVEEARKAAEEKAAADAQKKKTGKIFAIVIPAVCAVVAIILLIINVIIPNNKYNNAVSLMETSQYEEAIAAFAAMDGYKDSVALIEHCKNAAINAQFTEANALMEAGEYGAAIAIYESLTKHDDITEEERLEAAYLQADALSQSGAYIESYKAFSSLKDYKDSEEKASSIYYEYQAEKRNNAKIGDYVIFGSYEQDNVTSNGKEEVEWLVLDKEVDKILVISRYLLDSQPYDIEGEEVTWETCTLRKWLNSEFIANAFTSEEQALIVETTIPAQESIGDIPSSGRDTQDQVFLLGYDVWQYFESAESKLCTATDYAFAQGAWTNSNYDKISIWWLRTLSDEDSALWVDMFGDVRIDTGSVYKDNKTVRPAMWISIEP